MSVITVIIIFGIIVLAHEFGHFIVARNRGILVEEFAIGMGPKIFSFKPGETVYSLRLFPIGGFCKMLGEDASSSDTRAFSNKKVSARIAVAVAGAMMNFILAFFIFLFIILANGAQFPIIHEVMQGSPANQAGLMPGDKITQVNGTKINIYDDFSFVISDNTVGKPLDITVKRGDTILNRSITPVLDKETNRYIVGYYPKYKLGLLAKSEEGLEKIGLWEAISYAFYTCIFWIKLTFVGIIRLVTLKLPISGMAGPIGMVQVIGATYNETKNESFFIIFLTMAKFTAIISANLGVFNLLPLPALDGGRLVFLTIEGIRKKPIDVNKEGLVHLIGFVALMILAVFVAFNDIKKWM